MLKTKLTDFVEKTKSVKLDKNLLKFLDGKLGFFVGDIESVLDKNNEWVLKIITITDGLYFWEFYDINKCFEFLNKSDKNVYFHNLDFDLLFFLREEKISKMIKNEPIINSGNLIISLKIANVTFLNSLTLLPLPLKKVVSVFLKINDKKYQDAKNDIFGLSIDELREYCNKDVLYLYLALRFLESFFIDNYKTTLKLTIPALAFDVWKKHFLPDQNFLHISRRHAFFKEKYYFGGHTEKFVNDQYVFRNVHYYDVNSLYPYVMRDLQIINSKKIRTQPNVKRLKQLIKNKKLFYCELTISIDSEELRFFPVLDEKNHFNSYPTGYRKIKMSEIGLKFILKWGGWENIISVHEVFVGDEEINKKPLKPFVNYVDTFYKMRKSDKKYDLVCKLLLNSLYGKFGEKTERQSKYINVIEEKETDPVQIKFLHEKCVIETYKEDLPFWNLTRNRLDIAGKITETARLHMGDLINEIRKKGKVFYTDTDSIITDVNLEKEKKLKKLVNDKKLGFLSNEIGHKDSVIILGLKMYHFYNSGKKATKGVKNMELKDFKDVVRGKRDFENTRFTKFNTLIDKGFFGIQKVPYSIQTIRQRLDK